jgi:DNA-binding MarR family transcriptional regulator
MENRHSFMQHGNDLCSSIAKFGNNIAQIQLPVVEISRISVELEAKMLNELDRKILAILQVDSSVSMQEIAERVGLSSTPCWRRIQKLESMGYIKRTRPARTPGRRNLPPTATQAATLDCLLAFQFHGSSSLTLLAG